MSFYRIGAVGFVLILLAGCGFQPVYATRQVDATGEARNAFEAFRSVKIARIDEREGQFLRNRLTRLLHPSGRGPVTTHTLTATLSESTRGLAVARSAVASRANLKITVNYKLTPIDVDPNVDASDDESSSAISGSLSATSGYNIFNSEFQTLAAEKGARERAINDVAEQLRLRLAASLTAARKDDPQR